MVHPEGRCLRLEYGKTEYKETTLIMKFTNITFRGSLELSITGWSEYSSLQFYLSNNLDPYREYYKPDVFTFSGDKIIFDFNSAGDHRIKTFFKTYIFQLILEIFSTPTESRSKKQEI